MRTLLRGALSVMAIAALALGARVWMDPSLPAAQLGLVAQDALGRASLRADVGGLLLTVGSFVLAGAALNRARLLTVPLALVALALAGRLISVFVEGYAPAMAAPLALEAVALGILAAGRLRLRAV